MSEQITKLKEQIEKAFAEVESSEFLKLQIEKGSKRHSENFLEYMKKHPESNFREWSKNFEDQLNIHSTVPSELQAMGIALLALDKLEHEITDIYIEQTNDLKNKN